MQRRYEHSNAVTERLCIDERAHPCSKSCQVVIYHILVQAQRSGVVPVLTSILRATGARKEESNIIAFMLCFCRAVLQLPR